MACSETKNALIVLRKTLERTEDEKKILLTIHKLSKFPVTLDILQGTGAGKIMRSLAKRSGIVGIKASSVLNKWREVLAGSQISNEPSKKNIYKQSVKHGKEQHGKVKHSKEHSLKSRHKGYTNSEVNGNVERGDKMKNTHVKESSKYEHSNYSMEESSKYNSKVTNEFSHDSVNCEDTHTESPQHPEKSSREKNLSKHDLKKNNCVSEPHTAPICKKLKLEKPYSPEESIHSTTHKKQMYDCLLPSDSTSVKRSKDNFHKKKTLKSSKLDSEKKSNLVEKSSMSSDKAKKVKKNKDICGSALVTKKVSQKIVLQNAEEFTASEALFEDCLSFNDILPVKRKSSANKKVKINKSDSLHKVKKVSPTPKATVDSYKISNVNKSVYEDLIQEPVCSAKISKEMDIVSKTLPQPLPNYRPLPQRSYEAASPTKKKVMSNEEAIKFTSSRREKTAVYSGRKNHYLTEVPSLFECCTRVLIENIDDIEYMGEIPFFLLESMLRRCTPMQLYRLEHFNPYLLEDTNELWQLHCKRDYRNSKPQENETYRELYWRSHDEQEKRLRCVTANITASIANSNPVRKAKLAYIDAVVKPPREVARRQAKHGTALPTSHSVKAVSPTKTSPKPVVPAVKAPSTSRGPTEYKPQKPKVAPLMAKTLKSMKQCFRR